METALFALSSSRYSLLSTLYSSPSTLYCSLSLLSLYSLPSTHKMDFRGPPPSYGDHVIDLSEIPRQAPCPHAPIPCIIITSSDGHETHRPLCCPQRPGTSPDQALDTSRRLPRTRDPARTKPSSDGPAARRRRRPEEKKLAAGHYSPLSLALGFWMMVVIILHLSNREPSLGLFLAIAGLHVWFFWLAIEFEDVLEPPENRPKYWLRKAVRLAMVVVGFYNLFWWVFCVFSLVAPS
ncbi:uncharacterized protein BKA78DRAFT_53698 [Phyllosticta capitalensis]|uniref:uncharacterized protein n=1 Tax=Phyllosticta capitalensis TaxID=121624 RepID=UPI00312E8C70